MQDKSPYNINNNLEISNDFREYINNFVKDAALSGKGFDTFSRYAKIYGNNENVDIEALLKNISALLSAIKKYNLNESDATKQFIEKKAQNCFVNMETIDFVLKHTNYVDILNDKGPKTNDDKKPIINEENKPDSKKILYAIIGVCALVIIILVIKNSNRKIEDYKSEVVENTYSQGQNDNLPLKIKTLIRDYDFIRPFIEGRAVVKYGNKYGVINLDGKEIVPPLYDYIENFQENFAIVNKDGKFGSIEKSGNEIISCKFDKIDSNFSEGYAIVRQNNKDGYIDTLGNIVVTCNFFMASPFSEGLAYIYRQKKNSLFFDVAYIDKNGKIIIPYFQGIGGRFKNGFAWVGIAIDNMYQAQLSKIDKSGKIISTISKDYNRDYLPFFSEENGIYIWRKNNMGGQYINEKGDNIFNKDYIFPCPYAYGLSSAGKRKDGRDFFGYITKKGEEAIPFIYDRTNTFKEGLGRVYSKSKYGFVDTLGNEIIPIIYDEASDFSEGLASVKLNGEWMYINKNGEVVLKYNQ